MAKTPTFPFDGLKGISPAEWNVLVMSFEKVEIPSVLEQFCYCLQSKRTFDVKN
jgi:hypothetical protein